MADLKKITELEQVFHQLQKIQRQVSALSEFLVSKLRDQHGHAPKTEGMIDPRTGRQFGQKKIKED